MCLAAIQGGCPGSRYVGPSDYHFRQTPKLNELQLWNKYQTLLPTYQRSTVIYGHDSRLGLQLKPYSKGLDTGCVKGGQLTAMVIDNNVAEPKVEPKIVSVQCQNYGNLDKERVKATA